MSESDGDEGELVGDEGDHNPLPALDETVLLACFSGLEQFQEHGAEHPLWDETLEKYLKYLVKFQNERTVGEQARLFGGVCNVALQLYWPREMVLLIKKN